MSHIESIDPFSGESKGQFRLETFAEQEAKVLKLRLSQKKWKKTKLDERLTLVRQALQYFEQHREQIALDISEQMGRPLHYASGEITGFFERANHLCNIAQQSLAVDVLPEKDGFIRSIEHTPLGLVFVISAWNFPLLISVNSIVPALLAGNTVLLKHSGLTPKIGEHFEKAFKKLGRFDNLLFNSVLDHDVTGRVIEELSVDHVVFTGSVNGGRQILKHTSQKFMSPVLELGGKDGAYVHNDADIKYAVSAIVDGCMFNSGQSCCGIERVYVHEDVYDEFLAQAKVLVSKYQLGDPKKATTTLGPLAQAKSAQYMLNQVRDAEQKGAKIIVGGKSELIGKGTFFQATLISDATHEMEVMQEENFGPILPVMKVNSSEQAIELINDSDYGLTCALFTQDINIAKQMAAEIDTGTIFMNRCDYLDPALAWVGVKNSGTGLSLSKYGFHGLTRKKSLHFKIQV